MEVETRYKLACALGPPREARPAFARVKGQDELDDVSRAVLWQLVELREGIAERRDRPPFRIAPNDLLVALARRKPASVAEVRRLGGGRDRVHLAFGVCSQFSTMHRDCFAGWVQLRHHDHLQIRGGPHDLMTVGVLLSPRGDGVRAFDTTMYAVRGELQFSNDEIQALREAWPTPD